ncbi:glycoside hydrolase family 10 protein [Pedobacter alpinus]|uniref:Glycoside hydrolase family 10 protein n=1 Tax=Pedobacter alpinus TaxID=1590643 RepID=A0ABW5TTB6_9SPHI
MLKKYALLFPLFFVVASNYLYAQNKDNASKREFRAVWIATVKNIDWPSKPGLSTSKQQKELVDILDAHQKNGINAIMFQIRPSADALYAKSEEPWASFITGKQGVAPNPFYDPLDFVITEAHKRGMELHAWFNPYRATNDLDEKSISEKHITKTKPEWFFTYASKKYFNPALPDVRTYINKIVMNVVRSYDIDGVHFDDYFYPYPSKEPLPDSTSFAANNRGIKDINDWRRDNVDLLIKGIADSIRNSKNHVKFGISPFGIWRNLKEDPRGSDTNGLSGYSALYADVLKWTEKGWLDYVNPQVYFPFNYAPAAYEKLTDWWAKNSFGKHVYIGHGVYRLTEKKNGWEIPSQMPDQIQYLRKNNNIQGSIFFSSKSVTNNLGGFQDSLRTNLYKTIALPPTMAWLDHVPPSAPLSLKFIKNNNSVILSWDKPYAVRDGETAYGYVIYRTSGKETLDINNPKNILKVIYGDVLTFVDNSVKKGRSYNYTITAIDRLKNESSQANQLQVIFD